MPYELILGPGYTENSWCNEIGFRIIWHNTKTLTCLKEAWRQSFSHICLQLPRIYLLLPPVSRASRIASSLSIASPALNFTPITCNWACKTDKQIKGEISQRRRKLQRKPASQKQWHATTSTILSFTAHWALWDLLDFLQSCNMVVSLSPNSKPHAYLQISKRERLQSFLGYIVLNW